ncbi:MAG TPA: type I-F CRISPR-associated protein Csy1 [Vicinamibacterales bacterium]
MSDPSRADQIRRIIEEFLSARLQEKLRSLATVEGGAGNTPSNREELHRKFGLEAWIGDAAHRIQQLQAVTHSLKATHPDAKGTNLYADPTTLPALACVGSHCLGKDYDSDTVGNAAALDVVKFLRLPVGEATVWDLVRLDDPDVGAALSADPEQAQGWLDAFKRLMEPKGTLASHTLAKQVYWLVGLDPHDDDCYHLLAPLYATSLAHRVYVAVRSDRFSEESKSAHAARKACKYAEHVLHDYPGLAVQKLGGTKPQNISQLNSERRGENYLLTSLPPRWKSASVRPLLNTESMFTPFARRPAVKQAVATLRSHLECAPAANLQTRRRRDALVSDLLGELLMYRAELLTLPARWTAEPNCRLSAAERQWLDPDAEQSGRALPPGWENEVSLSFGRWLNTQLRDPLPMGDPEYMHWCALAQAEIEAQEQEELHVD